MNKLTRASKQMKPAKMRYPSITAVMAIFAVSFVCYWQTFHAPFLYDDVAYFIDGALFKGDAAPATRLTTFGAIWSFNAARAIPFATFAINYNLGGLDTFGYHVVNFVIHLFASVSLFFFARLIVQYGRYSPDSFDTGKARSKAAFYFPLFSALLFSAHPVQTEAVTYIWQRFTLLSALFYLLSMTLYLQSACLEKAGSGTNVRSNMILALSVGCGILAMFTKQIAVTLPVAIVMIDLYFISGSFEAFKQRAAKWGMFVPVLMIIPTLTLFGMNREMNDIGTRSDNILSPIDYLFTQFNVVARYLSLIIFPAGQNLDYDFSPAHSFLDAIGSFMLLLLILLAGAICYKKFRIVSFGIIFFFLALSVESTIFPLEDLIFEHRLYLPLAGFVIAGGWFIFYLLEKFTALHSSKIFALACMFLLVPLIVSTVKRNRILDSREALWRDVTQKSPNKPRGHIILGNLALEKGDEQSARKHYLHAYEIDPDSPLAALARYSIGTTYEKEGKQKMAMVEYQKAIDLNSSLTIANYSIAEGYLKSGNNRGAIYYYLKAARARPGSLNIRLKLGIALRMAKRFGTAILVFKGIIEKRPDVGEAYYNLGLIYRTQGKPAKALANFQLAEENGYIAGRIQKSE